MEFLWGLLARFNGLSLKKSDAKEKLPIFATVAVYLSSQGKIWKEKNNYRNLNTFSKRWLLGKVGYVQFSPNL